MSNSVDTSEPLYNQDLPCRRGRTQWSFNIRYDGAKPDRTEQSEIRRLRHDLERVQMERDILEKAIGIFSSPAAMRFRFHRGPLNVYPVRTVAPRRRSIPAATGTARTALALLPVAATLQADIRRVHAGPPFCRTLITTTGRQKSVTSLAPCNIR